MSHPLHIYTDGAARGNPGPGGYGVVMIWGPQQREFSAGYRLTTNNRMELLAVIRALESLKTQNIPVHVFTDSKYVADAIRLKWLDNWIRTDFKGGKKNKDLWTLYHRIAKKFQVQVHWVKGHADNVYNNRCDALATAAADGHHLLIDEGYEAISAVERGTNKR